MTCCSCHRGLTGAAPLHPFHVLAADRAACSQDSARHLPAGLCCPIALTEGQQRGSCLQHVVHSKNHQEWATGLCDRITCGLVNSYTIESPSHHSPTVLVEMSVHIALPIYITREQKRKAFLRRGMNFCPYLHQVQISASPLIKARKQAEK